MSDHRAELLNIVASALRVSTLPPTFDSSAPLVNLGLDSVSLLEAILRIEETFGVEVPDQELKTVVAFSFDQLDDLVGRLARLRVPEPPR